MSAGITDTERLVAATLAAARIQLKTGTVSAASAADTYVDCLLELKRATHETTGARAYVDYLAAQAPSPGASGLGAGPGMASVPGPGSPGPGSGPAPLPAHAVG